MHDIAGDVTRNGAKALAGHRPAIDAEYGGLDDFLRDVQRRYLTAVEARLDEMIEARPVGRQVPVTEVAEALDEVAEIHSDLRRLLREFGDDPALAEGDARLRRSVLAATGVDPTELLQDRRENGRKEAEHDRKPVLRTALRPLLAWLH